MPSRDHVTAQDMRSGRSDEQQAAVCAVVVRELSPRPPAVCGSAAGRRMLSDARSTARADDLSPDPRRDLRLLLATGPGSDSGWSSTYAVGKGGPPGRPITGGTTGGGGQNACRASRCARDEMHTLEALEREALGARPVKRRSGSAGYPSAGTGLSRYRTQLRQCAPSARRGVPPEARRPSGRSGRCRRSTPRTGRT